MTISKDLVDILPLLWKINDGLIITADNKVNFVGSLHDVEDFKAKLHEIDPDLIYEFADEYSNITIIEIPQDEP